MTMILGEEAIAAFRAHWDGPRLLDLIAAHGGGALVLWPIGVGKSCAIDRVIEAAVGSGSYDLVVAMFPTRRVLEERAWIRSPPPGVKIVNLRPRPRPRCGDLDGPWRHFEQAGMAALGRVELCGRCPRRPGCYWPGQYGERLEGAQVIFATDAHLGRVPDFAAQLAGWAGAARVLTLLDEIGFAATSFRRRVTRRDLALFADVLDVDSAPVRVRPGPRLGLPGAPPVAGPDGRPPIHRVAAAVLPAGVGDRRPGPRLGSPRHAVPVPRARPAAVRPVAPGLARAARQWRLELRRAPGRPRRRRHLQRDGPARVPPVPPGPRPGLPVRGLPVRPPRHPLVQHREQARDACPFPGQRRLRSSTFSRVWSAGGSTEGAGPC